MLARICLVLGLVVCALSLPAARNGTVFTVYQIPEWIRHNGYVAEIHHVVTHDGYILEMHRIPYGQFKTTSSKTRPVVFMMHGLMAASNSYIALGPEYSIAYNYADAGFDVWLGNARGNRPSRRHVTLDPDDSQDKREFFNLSFEEIGMYDVAEMIDYVLEYTEKEKLHYIGHSQGGTAFLALASMRPEYNEKFTTVHLMAGVGYQNHFPNTELRLLATLTDVIYTASVAAGFVEMYPANFNIPGAESTSYDPADSCGSHPEFKYLCDMNGVRELLRQTDNTEEAANLLGGAALKQIAHYGQNIRDRAFRRWNYGLLRNREIYGSVSPPIYNLSLITANVTMHYTVNDILLDEQDVLAMANDMPNTRVRKIAREDFGHADFIFALDAKYLITDYMIADMLQFETIELLEPEIDDTDLDGIEDSHENENAIIDPNLPDSSSIASLSVMIKIYMIFKFFNALRVLVN
ncbi:lipase 3-like [Aphomia sociella]